jgi:hypothetical protein
MQCVETREFWYNHAVNPKLSRPLQLFVTTSKVYHISSILAIKVHALIYLRFDIKVFLQVYYIIHKGNRIKQVKLM